MSNHKRKRPRRFARCKRCTPRKYVGNQASREAHGRGRWLNGNAPHSGREHIKREQVDQ